MKTALYETHKASAAAFTEYQGWEIPQHFGNPLEEYAAARRAVGLTDLSYRAKLRLTGPDRSDFLHRLLSNDIKNLKPGDGCRATLLTPQGKIIAEMRVYAAEREILIEMEPRARAATLDRLAMYKLTQRVEIEDVTEKLCLLFAHGPKSNDFIKALVGSAPFEISKDFGFAICDLRLPVSRCWSSIENRQSKIKNSMSVVRRQSFVVGGEDATALSRGDFTLAANDQRPDSQLGGQAWALSERAWVIRCNETGSGGYGFLAPATDAETLWRRLVEVGSDYGAMLVGFEAFNILRIEAGTPWYGVDMDEGNFPQEACLDDALHWQKGCYVGQEPVARIKYRGHVNKKLVGLKIAGNDLPEPDDKIFHESREVGHITSAVRSPHVGGPVALGYVRREVMQQGQALMVRHGDCLAQAVVSDLPFYPWMGGGSGLSGV